MNEIVFPVQLTDVSIISDLPTIRIVQIQLATKNDQPLCLIVKVRTEKELMELQELTASEQLEVVLRKKKCKGTII